MARYCKLIILVVLLASCVKINKTPEAISVTDDIASFSSINPMIPEHVPVRSIPDSVIPLCGTVSHHLLVAPLIDDYFKQLREARTVDTFIIIAPNHYLLSDARIALTRSDWLYGDTTIVSEKKHIDFIMSGLGLEDDREAFRYEHGVQVMFPFIAKYFPAAKVVTIVLNENKKELGGALKLADTLTTITKCAPDVFILLSIDFSHKADPVITAKRDLMSREVLLDRNRQRVRKIYTDNNIGLYTLFTITKQLGITNTHIFSHTNGSIYTGEDLGPETTSYFFTYFY